MSASDFEGIAALVGDGDFFSGRDIADFVDCFAVQIAVPTVVCVWETAMVYKVDRGIYSTDSRAWAARQSVCFYNTAEWVLSRKVVVKREELMLRGL